MARGDVHVVPGDQGWRVELEADGVAHSGYGAEEDARDTANEIARRTGGEVVVHGPDGEIRERQQVPES